MNAPDIISVAPYLEQLSFGAVAGFAAGYALKKLGKLVAVTLGLIFVILQVLAYVGFVNINWGEIERQVDPLLEASSLRATWSWLLRVLTFNLTFAAAFVPGFLVGLRRG